MDINKIAPPIQFLLSESDEIVAQKKKNRKKDNATLDIDHSVEETTASFFETEATPELPNLEAIRQKIINNEYQIDYEKLAKRMMEIEKLWIE